MSASQLPGGTVTFLFTDIEGSTRLLKDLRERYGELLGNHLRLVRDALDANRGREIDTQGEAFFAAFPRAKDAVSAAIAAQRAHAARDWPHGVEVRVRMGVHTAEPDIYEDRYVGLGVHRAARLCAVGYGGQVLLSRSTAGLVDEDELPGIALRDLGEHRLKDLERPERIYQLVAEDLTDEFPPLRTLTEVARETEAAARPTGTVTFLTTDIVGSTVLLRRLGRERYVDMLELYEELVRAAFFEADGHEVDVVGDSFVIAFQRPKLAVQAAAVVLAGVEAAAWPPSATPDVRIGIHTGEASPFKRGYVGFALIRAIRVCEAARPGQILVSQATESLLDPEELGHLRLRDVGEREVKDFDRPARLYEVVRPQT